MNLLGGTKLNVVSSKIHEASTFFLSFTTFIFNDPWRPLTILMLANPRCLPFHSLLHIFLWNSPARSLTHETKQGKWTKIVDMLEGLKILKKLEN